MTSQATHTPGNWHAQQVQSFPSDPDSEIPSGLGWTIEGPPQPLTTGQFAKAADAHMAAASPQLYNATEALTALVEKLVPEPVDPDIDRTLAHARDALLKAQGLAPSTDLQPPLI